MLETTHSWRWTDKIQMWLCVLFWVTTPNQIPLWGSCKSSMKTKVPQYFSLPSLLCCSINKEGSLCSELLDQNRRGQNSSAWVRPVSCMRYYHTLLKHVRFLPAFCWLTLTKNAAPSAGAAVSTSKASWLRGSMRQRNRFGPETPQETFQCGLWRSLQKRGLGPHAGVSLFFFFLI